MLENPHGAPWDTEAPRYLLVHVQMRVVRQHMGRHGHPPRFQLDLLRLLPVVQKATAQPVDSKARFPQLPARSWLRPHQPRAVYGLAGPHPLQPRPHTRATLEHSCASHRPPRSRRTQQLPSANGTLSSTVAAPSFLGLLVVATFSFLYDILAQTSPAQMLRSERTSGEQAFLSFRNSRSPLRWMMLFGATSYSLGNNSGHSAIHEVPLERPCRQRTSSRRPGGGERGNGWRGLHTEPTSSGSLSEKAVHMGGSGRLVHSLESPCRAVLAPGSPVFPHGCRQWLPRVAAASWLHRGGHMPRPRAYVAHLLTYIC